ENFRVRGADHTGVAVREIDAAVGQADVVEERDNLVFRNHLSNRLVDLIGQAGRFFDAQAGACTEVEANLAGVNTREKVAAEYKGDAAGQNAEEQETAGEDAGVFENVFERALIGFTEAFKATLEALLEAAEKALFFADMLFGVIFVL